MAGRGYLPPGYGGSSDQAPGMMHHGPFAGANPTLETLPPELAVQEAESERLLGDNHRLAPTIVALSRDLVASKEDIQRIRENIRSTQTEADSQIQILMETIVKMEAERSAGESIKEELQQAHSEAQGLLKTNQELNAQIRQAHGELEIARADIQTLAELQSELESLKKERQRLRTSFEDEKRWNMEKINELKGKQMDLASLSAMVADAERKARATRGAAFPAGSAEGALHR